MTTMASLMTVKGPALSSEQKTFNRLRKKIESLQRAQERRIQELNECLLFYFNTIQPAEKAFQSALIERFKVAYQFYKTQRCFSWDEQEALKELLLDDIDEIDMLSCGEDSAEIKRIYEELGGADYDEAISIEFGHIKDEMKGMLKEFGIDMDLSNINLTDSQDEVLRKLFESVDPDILENGLHAQERPKTKKQIEKELKQRQVKEMQKKGVNAVYKQLAKAFHPDLEHDDAQKAHKEELMKRLTTAYENNDLYALLALEMEWMNGSKNADRLINDAQLKTYNAVLKDQVKALQESIDMLILHHKYFPIHRFHEDFFGGMFAMKIAYSDLKADINTLQSLAKRLKTSEAETIIRRAIEKHPFRVELRNRNFNTMNFS